MTIPAKQVTNLPRNIQERLTIATANTIPALALTPINAASIKLFINGVKYDSLTTPATFTANAKALTWSASNAGFNLDSNDRVTAEYITVEAAS